MNMPNENVVKKVPIQPRCHASDAIPAIPSVSFINSGALAALFLVKHIKQRFPLTHPYYWPLFHALKSTCAIRTEEVWDKGEQKKMLKQIRKRIHHIQMEFLSFACDITWLPIAASHFFLIAVAFHFIHTAGDLSLKRTFYIFCAEKTLRLF